MHRLVVIFSVFILLQGCLSIRPDQPTFSNAPTPQKTDDLATVYMHFDDAPGSRIAFYVDERHYFNALWNTYSWVQVKPGNHIFKAQVGFWDMDLAASAKESTANKPVSTEVTLEAGKTYYMELTTSGAITGTSASYAAGVYSVEPQYTEFGKTLELVNEERGLATLRRSVYIKPLISSQIR